MAHNPNLQTLAILLQAPELNTATQEEADQINNLPPLDHYTTGSAPRQFIYDEDEGLICYVSQDPIFQTPEYQEILSQKPILDFLGIQVFEAQLSVTPLA